MSQRLLLGDEALAQGALNAGLSGCYAYPGTPSTEIMEYVQSSKLAEERGVHREWSTNEKAAMEEAVGMSFAGKRAMVCMKHVGLNACADGFMNSAVTGARGGLAVVVADDPSMHSSQNEQDSRYYAQFAMIPCVEPSSQQEAYEMMSRYVFEVSERLGTPILVRLSTRLSHSRANVEVGEPEAIPAPIQAAADDRHFVLLPAIAKKNYERLCGKQPAFEELSDESPFNQYLDGADKSIGVIASGLAFNYVMEAFGGNCPHPVLKISQYPLPRRKLARLMEACRSILCVEEGMPFIEKLLRGPLADPRIQGRMTGRLPRTGELNPRLVAEAFQLELPPVTPPSPLLRMRPPRLCDGCPHADTYRALTAAIADQPTARVFGDIGCYTLGALPPYNAISSCLDMGASVTMAKGAADAGIRPAIAVIGDSTFTHSGMPGTLDVVWENAPVTIVILDNLTTGMTGGQSSFGAGRIEDIVAGLGVAREHIRVITPLPGRHDENVAVFRKELAFQGPSVIIARRECIQTLRHKAKK